MAQVSKVPEATRVKLAENLRKARAAKAAKAATATPDPATLTRPTPPLARDRVAARRYLEHEMRRALERVTALRALLASMGEKV
jgi:hypothetical protein